MARTLLLKRTRAFLFLFFSTAIFEGVKAQAPVIITQPRDTNVCFHDNATFTVAASNTPTSYTWEYTRTINPPVWINVPNNAIYSGLNTSTLTVDTHYDWFYYYRCIATNASGSSTPSDSAFLDVTELPSGIDIYVGTYSVCQGATGIQYKSGLNQGSNRYTWTYSGSGATISQVSGDSLIAIDFDLSATSGNLILVDSGACGKVGPITKAITINPLQPTPAAVAGGGAVCYNAAVAVGGTTSSDPATCNTISTLIASGASPVNGPVSTCVTVDASVQSYNGIPYVQRHYEIEPSTNAATATATLTLYFTQADFDNYNLARGTNPALPMGSGDAAGIANLRITQFHGTGTTPGTYAGGSGEIDPLDANIVWNATANRWEVTFDITGFSGFFVSSGSLTPLPLTLISFTAQAGEDVVLLNWTTASEQNTSYFELQRSSDGVHFLPLATLAAAGNSNSIRNYSATDPLAGSLQAVYFYRLKMVDIDGKSNYSRVAAVKLLTTVLTISLLPNPFHGQFTATISAPKTTDALLTVTDLSGKLLLKQNISLKKGVNNLDGAKISLLANGMYFMTVTTGAQHQTIRLIKE